MFWIKQTIYGDYMYPISDFRTRWKVRNNDIGIFSKFIATYSLIRMCVFVVSLFPNDSYSLNMISLRCCKREYFIQNLISSLRNLSHFSWSEPIFFPWMFHILHFLKWLKQSILFGNSNSTKEWIVHFVMQIQIHYICLVFY